MLSGCCYPEDPDYRYADDCYDIETESDCDKFSRRSGCRWTTNCGAGTRDFKFVKKVNAEIF